MLANTGMTTGGRIRFQVPRFIACMMTNVAYIGLNNHRCPDIAWSDNKCSWIYQEVAHLKSQIRRLSFNFPRTRTPWRLSSVRSARLLVNGVLCVAAGMTIHSTDTQMSRILDLARMAIEFH